MGDSETVIAETSSVMGYTSATYSNAGYANPDSNVVHHGGGFDQANAAYPVPNIDSDTGDGTTYSMNPNSTIQEHSTAVGVTDGSGNVVGTENSVSSQAAGYGSVNGNIAGEDVNVQLTENGDSDRAVSETIAGQSFGSGMWNFDVIV